MAMLWMALNAHVTWCGQRDGQPYTLLDTSTADTLVLDHSFFRPLGMQHFYDSFALTSQSCVRRDALTLFGLKEDELLPDLHITRAGVLRIGLGAHQEHRINHEARAADEQSLRRSSSWLPMRWIPSLTRLSRLWVPVTLKVVKGIGCFFFPALPSEYETLSVNNWKYAKESNSLEQTCKK